MKKYDCSPVIEEQFGYYQLGWLYRYWCRIICSYEDESEEVKANRAARAKRIAKRMKKLKADAPDRYAKIQERLRSIAWNQAQEIQRKNPSRLISFGWAPYEDDDSITFLISEGVCCD